MLQPKDSNNFMLILMGAGLFVGLVMGSTLISLPVWATLLVGHLLVFGVLSTIYLIVKRKHIKELLPLRPLGWLNTIMIIGMSLMIQPLMALVNVVSQFAFPNIIAGAVESTIADDGLFLALTIFAVVPSIFEEVAFRGIGLAGFKGVKIHTAAIINGLIFGMIHMNMNQFFYAFFLGAIFCYFVYYTKSLWAPILAHFVINGTQAILMFISTLEAPEAAIEMEPHIAGVILVVAFIAAVTTGIYIAIYKAFKRHNIQRNEAAGIVTDTTVERPSKALTWAVWVITGFFVFMMLLAYVVVPLIYA